MRGDAVEPLLAPRPAIRCGDDEHTRITYALGGGGSEGAGGGEGGGQGGGGGGGGPRRH
jgi:hypothetical protein